MLGGFIKEFNCKCFTFIKLLLNSSLGNCHNLWIRNFQQIMVNIYILNIYWIIYFEKKDYCNLEPHKWNFKF